MKRFIKLKNLTDVYANGYKYPFYFSGARNGIDEIVLWIRC